MSITLKSTLAGALCGALVFAIAPAELGWAQQNCDPEQPCPPTGGKCAPGKTTCVGAHRVGECFIGGQCRPIVGNLPAPTTALGVALVSIGREVYVFETAGDPNIKGHVLYSFFQTGGSGTGWFDLGGDADTAPAVAAVPDPAGTYVFVYIKDSTGHIKINQGSPDANNWVGWQ
jgi:hypothetical protein